MSNRVSVGQMAASIMDALEEYADLATDDMKSAVRKSAKTVKTEISATAPRDTEAYAKSWATKTTSETSNSLAVTVHSKNRYQLAHLLEHGHAKRSGGRVSARPHIAAAEQKGIALLESEIERSIAHG